MHRPLGRGSSILIFDLQKRIEKLELISKIKKLENGSEIKELEIKVVSLNNWEKRIINYLKKNDGELTQVELRHLTGLSRSNLSKHLSLLDEKKIIKKKPYKRTNKIFLIKNIID
ncbi:MAG: winged helix-turn-helix transcriptional regulator [Candidatus Lokiarchaeota archaeon]|nr:winged helix-turn-helix transcriptional regulator [Candidatus Lokiarchaeota archaeon]